MTVQDIRFKTKEIKKIVKPGSRVRREEDNLESDFANLLRAEIAAAPGSLSATSASQYLGTRIPSAVSLIDRIQNGFMPQTNEEAIEFAFNWYEIDDMLSGLIDIKTKFCTNGMSFEAFEKNSSYINNLLTLLKKSESSTDQGGTDQDSTGQINTEQDSELSEETLKQLLELVEFNEKMENIAIQYHLYDVVEQLIKDFIISDTMILYWRTISAGADAQDVDADLNLQFMDSEVKGLIDVNALHPSEVRWENSLGQDELSIKIPLALKVRIEIALNEDDSSLKKKMLEGLIKEGIPESIIKAVENGDEFVPLDREEGDNWIIVTRERLHHGIAKPSMVKIFIPLATRKMNTEGEFAASLMMKHFIFHITAGESIESGPNAGSVKNWATQDECEAYMDKFKGVNKTTVIATNHTVKFNFIHPPLEMFSVEKYVSSSGRISSFVGISTSLSTGEGGKYAGGYLSIKRLLSDISYVRDKVKKMFIRMFSHETIVDTLEIPDNFVINLLFNELHLKEQKEILDEVSELSERSMFGPRNMLTELGRSHQSARFDRLIAIAEDKVSGVWGNTFYKKDEQIVENQEGVNDNNSESSRADKRGGRPANPETVPGEGTRTQSPSAK